MTAQARIEPRVGIFWFFGGKLILDTMPVSQGELYGEILTHPRGHLQHWTELQRGEVVPPDVEYEDPPRGRVVYHPGDKWFVFYADRCILMRKKLVERIMRKMSLPAKRTKTSRDEHYRCSRCLS